MPERSRAVVVGLGANLGSRVETPRAARFLLSSLPGVTLRRTSRLYRSAALGEGAQPEFRNAAVSVETALAPDELLSALLELEATLGRVRRERWGPRAIDLDVLWDAAGETHTASLDVPHPALLERAFALAPALDVVSAAPPGWPERLAELGGAPSAAHESWPEPSVAVEPVAGAARGAVDLVAHGADEPDAVAAVLTAAARYACPRGEATDGAVAPAIEVLPAADLGPLLSTVLERRRRLRVAAVSLGPPPDGGVRLVGVPGRGSCARLSVEDAAVGSLAQGGAIARVRLRRHANH